MVWSYSRNSTVQKSSKKNNKFETFVFRLQLADDLSQLNVPLQLRTRLVNFFAVPCENNSGWSVFFKQTNFKKKIFAKVSLLLRVFKVCTSSVRRNCFVVHKKKLVRCENVLKWCLLLVFYSKELVTAYFNGFKHISNILRHLKHINSV